MATDGPAVTVRSGDQPLATVTALHIEVTGADPTVRYYLEATQGDEDARRSVEFAPSSDGKWEWDGLILPTFGEWAIALNEVDGDNEAASASVNLYKADGTPVEPPQ